MNSLPNEYRWDEIYVYADGASRGNPGKAGAGIVITNSHDHVLSQKRCYLGTTTNNVAEYRALILALDEAKKLGANTIRIFMDSELIVKQVKGIYKVKSVALRGLFDEVQRLLKDFRGYDIVYIRRKQNSVADRLANQAIDLETM